MQGDETVSLALVEQPEHRWQGRLLRIDGPWAVVALAGCQPISAGALVEIESTRTLYLGEVESSAIEGEEQRLRVHVEHELDLERVARIQKLWENVE